MKFEFVRADVLRNVQKRLIERYGGVHGVRDKAGLESAVARPRNLAEYGGVQTAPALAAALAWGIVRNHPFLDGNKRTPVCGAGHLPRSQRLCLDLFRSGRNGHDPAGHRE